MFAINKGFSDYVYYALNHIKLWQRDLQYESWAKLYIKWDSYRKFANVTSVSNTSGSNLNPHLSPMNAMA